MPTNKWKIENGKLRVRIPKSQISILNSKGFTLIEIVLSLFLILAIITVFLTTSSTYATSRNSNLQSVATKIASREMEKTRSLVFDAVANEQITDSDLAKLPNSSGEKTVTQYGSDLDIKQVTVNVAWTTNGTPKNIKLETLIYRNGL